MGRRQRQGWCLRVQTLGQLRPAITTGKSALKCQKLVLQDHRLACVHARLAQAKAIQGQPSKALQAQLGAAPVTPLGIVANLVVCAEANPVGDGPVLLGLLGQLLLNLEGLVGRHFCCALPNCRYRERQLARARELLREANSPCFNRGAPSHMHANPSSLLPLQISPKTRGMDVSFSFNASLEFWGPPWLAKCFMY